MRSVSFSNRLKSEKLTSINDTLTIGSYLIPYENLFPQKNISQGLSLEHAYPNVTGITATLVSGLD